MTSHNLQKQYECIPLAVEAYQVQKEGFVQTNREERDIGYIPEQEYHWPGDWVVTTPNGITRVWTDEKFRAAYREIKAARTPVTIKTLDAEIIVNKTINFLNEINKIDPKWMQSMFLCRAACNKELADHPSVIVHLEDEKNENGDDTFSCRFMGFLNGLIARLGDINNSKGGPIMFQFNEETRAILGFDKWQSEDT